MEVEGYVCNNQKCGNWGSPKYVEYEGDPGCSCPRCKEDRTILPVREKKEVTGEKIGLPGVKLDNGKYYG